MTGILFVFWKSELAQPIFDFANSHGIGINRTVDYTDFVALLILPISYYYWNTSLKKAVQPKRIFKPIIIGICCFSFIATTLASHREKLNLKSNFHTTLHYDIEILKKDLEDYEDSSITNRFYIINLEDRDAEIWTKISLKRIDSTKTEVYLDSITRFKVQGTGFAFFSNIDEDDVNYMQKLTVSEIEVLFEKSINKKIIDK